MIEPWNDSSILPPPVNTILYSPQIDVRDLTDACNNAIKVLSQQSPFYQESALLSRFLYKFDRKFRNDIGYRIIKKINTALRRFLSLNLLNDIQNFFAALPKTVEEKYSPTRQMLEYVMIRIITFSKIMMRVCICSKQAAVYYMNRVKRGESHWMSLMPYALLSRIWTMSSVLLDHSCSWYKTLHTYLEQLQPKGVDFLPHNYVLPNDLSVWLDVKNLDSFGRFEWSNKNNIQINLDLVDDDEVTFDSILDYVKDINDDTERLEPLASSKLQEKATVPTVISAHLSVDQGVSVSREYFQSFFRRKEEGTWKEDHSADNVTNKISLDKFIDKEEHFRNENSELSVTKHLSFMQWLSLRTSLVNLSNTLSKNRKIEIKFKKIWKEKCLDYL